MTPTPDYVTGFSDFPTQPIAALQADPILGILLIACAIFGTAFRMSRKASEVDTKKSGGK
jgi:hypothetical protein